MRRKFFKQIAALCLVTILLLTGFGCKGMNTEEKQATQSVTLEYWTVFDNVDALNSLVAEYQKTRPYISVNIRQLRSDEVYTRLVEQLAEDNGPDIISVPNRSLLAYQSKLAPMPAAVKDTTVLVTKSTLGTNTAVNTVDVPTVTLNQLDKEYVQTVKKDAIVEGKIYGLPLSLDTMAIYYNKDLLDRSGVPEPPKNWDDFQAAVKKITKYDKTTGDIVQSGAAFGAGSNIPGADDIIFSLLKQSGAEMVDTAGQAVFNRGANEGSKVFSALNFYTDYANSSRDTYSWNKNMGNALDRFVSGSVGFFFGYSYHLEQIKARAPQLNLGIMPMLQINSDSPINVANYWLQTVVNKSKHQNEAWNFINYLTHSSATKTYLEKTGRPTALRAYISAQNSQTDLAPFSSQVLVSENWYRGKNYEAARKAVNDMLDKWIDIAPDAEGVEKIRQNILNDAVAKINQTL